MEVEKLIGKPLRDAPKEVEDLAQQLLLRSGYFYMVGPRILVTEGGNRILSKCINTDNFSACLVVLVFRK